MRVRRARGRAEFIVGLLLVIVAIGNPGLRAVSVVMAAPGADPATAQKLVQQGIEAYQAGKYPEAIKALQSARSLGPDVSAITLYLGLAHLRMDDVKGAIEEWRQYENFRPSTKEEQNGHLDEKVNQYLTLLLREESHRLAKEAVAEESKMPPGDPSTVAITYYRNLGSPELASLQKGLTALLIDDVSKVKKLKVVEREHLQALLEEMKLGTTGLVDARTAPKVGRLLGAGKIAAGSYADYGKESMRVSSEIADSTSASVLGTQESNGKVKEFFEVEKVLALHLLKDLGFDEQKLAAEGVLDQIQTPQTKSIEAMNAFSSGLELKDQGQYDGARTQFEKSLKADPNFDLARKQLLALPLVGLTIAAIITSTESSAPSAASATAAVSSAGMASAAAGEAAGGAGAGAGAGGTAGGAGGISAGTAALVAAGVAVAAGAAVGGVAASGGFSSGGGGGGGNPTPGSGCTVDQFRCNDGTCIPASSVCNHHADCTGGEDEAPSICGNAQSCCIATNGCVGETGTNCAQSCCCCPVSQACCANHEQGCCAAP
jgi:tetratricopeptide (TPR) repeat protein